MDTYLPSEARQGLFGVSVGVPFAGGTPKPVGSPPWPSAARRDTDGALGAARSRHSLKTAPGTRAGGAGWTGGEWLLSVTEEMHPRRARGRLCGWKSVSWGPPGGRTSLGTRVPGSTTPATPGRQAGPRWSPAVPPQSGAARAMTPPGTAHSLGAVLEEPRLRCPTACRSGRVVPARSVLGRV